GKAGLANARLAYQVYEELFATERWALLADAGALPQRPLWASTGVKDPDYDDTRYVVELVAPGTVNTAPEKTIAAVADHGVITGDTVTGSYDEANATLDALEKLGVSYNDVVALLETEGLDKFVASWKELLADVEGALTAARKAS
ncbi:MAG: transaldolase family protein, partial [Actinomycetes bacterium]